MGRIRKPEDEDSTNNTGVEFELVDRSSSSGGVVAARNGLWVILRCRPYCAAAVKPEYTTQL